MVTATTTHESLRQATRRWNLPTPEQRQVRASAGTVRHSRRLFGPLASFLLARTGCRWSQVLRELEDRSASSDAAARMLSEASELVAVNVRLVDGVLRFGDGLLVGLPLRAGWRKKLYVCPNSGRLQRIPD